MIVAIPTDNDVTISAHAGRCQGFAIYEIQDGKSRRVDYRTNTFTHHVRHHDHDEAHEHSHEDHGHGNHSHTNLLEAIDDCDTFLAVGIGRGLVNDLQTNGVTVLYSQEQKIDDAIALLASGQFASNPQGSSCSHKH